MKKENFGYRLQKALNIQGMKQIELAEKTNIPKSAISQYISNSFEPKQDRVEILAKTLNVSEAWLMGYDVPMEREPHTNSNSNPSSPNTSATDDDIKFALFNSKDGITDEMLDEVKEFAKFVKSKYKK